MCIEPEAYNPEACSSVKMLSFFWEPIVIKIYLISAFYTKEATLAK